MKEKISIGSDHAGFRIKQDVIEYLKELGYEPEDLGAYDTASVDYPDFAGKVASLVSTGQRGQGILICGTGIGMSIAANKFPNVRAAVCVNENMAELARKHNDANILALGGRLLTPGQARAVVKKWLETDFEGGRHRARIYKIARIERRGKDSGS